jgi:hypothetical protein
MLPILIAVSQRRLSLEIITTEISSCVKRYSDPITKKGYKSYVAQYSGTKYKTILFIGTPRFDFIF